MTVLARSASASLRALSRLFFEATMRFIEFWTSAGRLIEVMSVVTST